MQQRVSKELTYDRSLRRRVKIIDEWRRGLEKELTLLKADIAESEAGGEVERGAVLGELLRLKSRAIDV